MTKKPATPSSPRIALVCDWLTTPGGAEKVLLELHQMYPDAPIYTSQYSQKGINWFKDADVRTGWLHIFPAKLRKILGPLRQIYFSRLDLSDYDLVISVTGAEAKSIRTTPKKTPLSSNYSTDGKKSQEKKAYHLCYCHVPTQYYWQMYDSYLKNPGFGFLNPVIRLLLKLIIKPLRRADFRASQRPDQFITISTYAAEQIHRYYHREAVIIAPPVDLQRFHPKNYQPKDPSPKTPQQFHKQSTKVHKLSTIPSNNPTNNPPKSTSYPPSRPTIPQTIHQSPQVIHKLSTRNPHHFIIACRQATWKRIDLAIEACLATGDNLTVIGDGSEHSHLVELARQSPRVRFISWLDASDLVKHLQSSQAYLFPSLEPFGIAAVEALAAGCPVIAYAEGGSRDIVVPGQNGLLFNAQTVDSLTDALRRFNPEQFDRSTVIASADRFSSLEFRHKIQQLINKALSSHSQGAKHA